MGQLVIAGVVKGGSATHAALHALIGCAGGAKGAAASSVLTGLFNDSTPRKPTASARPTPVARMRPWLEINGDS